MTLTCDTAPVTDPDPTLDRLRDYAERIAAAKKAVTDLEDERNAEIVRVVETWPEHGAIVATARAAGLSRQHVDRIRRMARARRAGQHDPQ